LVVATFLDHPVGLQTQHINLEQSHKTRRSHQINRSMLLLDIGCGLCAYNNSQV